jgi:hypothetical protein
MRTRLGFVIIATSWLGQLQACSPRYELLSREERAGEAGSSGIAGNTTAGSANTSGGAGMVNAGGAEAIAHGGEDTAGGSEAAGGVAP